MDAVQGIEKCEQCLHILERRTELSTRIADPASSMRKQPRQARSRATVEAIVEAGARILSERGWAGFTTNRVAEIAGVSTGSLYQYFPDKAALVEAIRRRHIDDSLAAVSRSLAETKPLADFVEGLVGGVIEAHSLHPGLHRVLLDEAPGLPAYRDQNNHIEKEYLSCYAAAVARYRARPLDASDEAIGIIISDAIDGVIHNAARRGTLAAPEIRSQLVRMIRLYLGEAGQTAPAPE